MSGSKQLAIAAKVPVDSEEKKQETPFKPIKRENILVSKFSNTSSIEPSAVKSSLRPKSPKTPQTKQTKGSITSNLNSSMKRAGRNLKPSSESKPNARQLTEKSQG
jgi:hypothetical protein